MKIAETVTFGGSGLDRAAELRADVAAVKADPAARVVLLWRGKPMMQADVLVRAPMDHPVLADASDAMILLGRDETGPLLAADMSGWEPAGVDPAVLDSFLDQTEQTHPAMPDAAFAELRSIMTRLTPRDAELAATAKAVFAWHQTHPFLSLIHI